MIGYIQKFLGKLGDFENKHFWIVLFAIILVSFVAIIGITKVEFQSDFDEMNPDDLDSIKLSERITNEFSDFNSFLVVIELEDSEIIDIRDPQVIEFLKRLNHNLKEESKIESVSSVGLFFQNVPEDLEQVKFMLSKIPSSENFFDDSYSLTFAVINADVSTDSEKINELTERVREIIEDSGVPNGVKTTVTGEPALGSAIFNLIISDGIYTLSIAIVLIFILLLIIQRSVKNALVVIIPVLFGICWTIGGLGWFGIPITIATAAIGAMLLGLGIEYSIFLVSRYNEERIKNNSEKSIVNALSTTGASTVSSGITTLIGFFALTLSLFPVLSDLGFSLGLGILFILVSVMTTGPIIIILDEKYISKVILEKKPVKKKSKLVFIFEKYGELVSKRTYLVIIIALILTIIMYFGISRIQQEEIDFENTLPNDLEELIAFQKISNSFGNPSSVSIYVEIENSFINSNEPKDIRDPRVIRYIDRLSEKSENIIRVESVESISELEKENLGYIPSLLSEQKKVLKKLNFRQFINSDFSGSVIRLRILEDSEDYQEEIARQVRELIETTEQPIGLRASATGNPIISYELNSIVGPDSSRTAMIAFILIVVFLFLISRSFKYTILPLITVVVAIVWILGLIGYFQVSFNSIISSVISMTIGIGIDFGIQLSQRFRQELENHNKRRAMCLTLKNTLYPMIITVIAALIGFRAMSLGELKIMENLGNTMSFAIFSSMIVAISLVAGLMLIFERDRKKT